MARVVRFSEETAREAAKAVREGSLIVYPTDTLYAVGCDPANEGAVANVFRAKGRGSSPLPVLCDSTETAGRLVDLGGTAADLAARFWPGALTIVRPLTAKLPEALHQGTGWLGVRVPASKRCVGLVRDCGGSLVGTSANLSGEPTARTAAEAAAMLPVGVELYLDGGTLEGAPSTVVRVEEGRITVLRQGRVRVGENP